MDISALEWTDAGIGYRLSFTGDVFETEDQRNWTDASFKTYSTPLARPFPVNIASGDTVSHSVLLEATQEPGLDGGAAAVLAQDCTASGPVSALARITGEAGTVPALGVGAGPAPELLPLIPGLDAMVVELIESPGKARRAGWAVQLEAGAKAAAFQGAGLDIRAVTAEPVRAVEDLANFLPQAERLAVFHPDSHLAEPETWPELVAAVRAAGFNGRLLAGTRSHFTELNRHEGLIPSDADAITFSITPQMHSTELAHMIESLPMQRLVAQNALCLGHGRPLHVGPVTLLPRFNAVATTGVATRPDRDELQFHPFTAVWVLASVDALTMDGIASVSYFEASGPNGVSNSAGQLSPAGELLQELAALRDSAVLSVSSAAGDVTLYPVQSPKGLILFAGNLSGFKTSVDIQLPFGTLPGGSKCLVFGQGATTSIQFDAGDGAGHAHGRLMMGPWSAGAVHFSK